jgi:hypothetical protein
VPPEQEGHAGTEGAHPGARLYGHEPGHSARDPRRTPQAGNGTGDFPAGTVTAQDRSADWRDQLMTSARDQWMPKVPRPVDPAATQQPPEHNAPGIGGLAALTGASAGQSA